MRANVLALATAALGRVQQGRRARGRVACLTPQQHASIAWSVAHFVGPGGWQEAPGAGELAAAAEALHAALRVPFRVAPLLLPGLSLEALMEEVEVGGGGGEGGA